MLFNKFTDEHLADFHGRSRTFLVLGILLVILGCIAISAAVVTTIISVIFLGFLLLTGGVIMLCDSFSFWHRRGFFSHLVLSVFYVIAGVLLIAKPVLASVSLTLLLGIFYIIAGIFRISFATGTQSPLWGWAWFNGIIGLLIGVLILTSWPASSLFIIGLFVGIDLVFAGFAYLMPSMVSRKRVVSKRR